MSALIVLLTSLITSDVTACRGLEVKILKSTASKPAEFDLLPHTHLHILHSYYKHFQNPHLPCAHLTTEGVCSFI